MRVLWTVVLMLGMVMTASADIRASLDKTQISLDETVHLTISVDDQAMIEQLDLSGLKQSFDIVGRNIRSLISMNNGVVTNETHLELVLRPKIAGALSIPSIRVGQANTEPLVLQVLDEKTELSAQADSAPPVLIEAGWENKTKPYVQSQLNLVIRIYHRGTLPGAALDEPRPKDALIKRLGEDVHGVVTKNGIEYQTLERHYAVFPQKSGEFVVPAIPMQMRAPIPKDQARRLFGFDVFNRRMITLRTEPLKLDILPRPAEDSALNWLPAEQITLSSAGLPDEAVSVGEAINMQLDLNATGLNAEQLPEISFSVDEAQFSVYPDEPSFENKTDGRVIFGSRKQTFVLIPKQAGESIIPDIELAWWNKTLDKQMVALIPQTQLRVLAVPGTQTSPLASDSALVKGNTLNSEVENQVDGVADEVRIWKWIAAAIFVAWLLTLVYFLFYRRNIARPIENAPDESSPDTAPSFARIKHALKAKQWEELWQALNQYGQVRWPDDPPKSPHAWAQKLGDPNAQIALAGLEAYLFDHQDADGWQERDFTNVVMPLLRASFKAKSLPHAAPGPDKILPALYPSA